MEMILSTPKLGEHTILFDKEDSDIILSRSWYLMRSGKKFVLPVSEVEGRKIVFMHNLLFEGVSYHKIIHIDGNGLNNKRSNLKVIEKPIIQEIENEVIKITVDSFKFGKKDFLIDKCDLDLISPYRWGIANINSRFYIRAAPPQYHVHRNFVMLHRLIMGNPDKIVDHKNRNTLDNRRCNLRIATAAQNARNRSMQSNNTSGYIGVQYIPKMKKWRASISVKGKFVHCGYFTDKVDAAKKYNEVAVKYHGEFANLNEIK